MRRRRWTHSSAGRTFRNDSSAESRPPVRQRPVDAKGGPASPVGPLFSFHAPREKVEYAPERVWQGDDEGWWWTDYPPPAGFDGIEHGTWGTYGYKRTCTDEETALLDANAELDQAEERDDDESERDGYFADLAANSEDPEGEPEAKDVPAPPEACD